MHKMGEKLYLWNENEGGEDRIIGKGSEREWFGIFTVLSKLDCK